MGEAQQILVQLHNQGVSDTAIARLIGRTLESVNRIRHGHMSGTRTLPRLRRLAEAVSQDNVPHTAIPGSGRSKRLGVQSSGRPKPVLSEANGAPTQTKREAAPLTSAARQDRKPAPSCEKKQQRSSAEELEEREPGTFTLWDILKHLPAAQQPVPRGNVAPPQKLWGTGNPTPGISRGHAHILPPNTPARSIPGSTPPATSPSLLVSRDRQGRHRHDCRCLECRGARGEV